MVIPISVDATQCHKRLRGDEDTSVTCLTYDDGVKADPSSSAKRRLLEKANEVAGQAIRTAAFCKKAFGEAISWDHSVKVSCLDTVQYPDKTVLLLAEHAHVHFVIRKLFSENPDYISELVKCIFEEDDKFTKEAAMALAKEGVIYDVDEGTVVEASFAHYVRNCRFFYTDDKVLQRYAPPKTESRFIRADDSLYYTVVRNAMNLQKLLGSADVRVHADKNIEELERLRKLQDTLKESFDALPKESQKAIAEKVEDLSESATVTNIFADLSIFISAVSRVSIDPKL